MHSILSRSPVPVAGNGHPQRVPRKATSFLSLRREKDVSPTLDIPDSSAPLPSLSKQTYFDAYPTPASVNSRRSKSKGKDIRNPSPARTDPSHHNDSTSSARRRRAKEPADHQVDDNSFAFPTFEEAKHIPSSFAAPGDSTPTFYSRTRSRTGPSGRSNWSDIPSVPHLRFSGSSTQTHHDTPQTPIDSTSSDSSLDRYPVVVAAPISGVETMDALVDGMNGGDDIIGHGISRSSRAKFGIPGHHPLYQPPLPTPPPGVVLGGGKTRKFPQANDSGDDEENYPKPISRPRRRRPRPPVRITSNSTITGSPTPSPTLSSFPETPKSSKQGIYDTTPSKPSAYEKPKAVAPSISEIIRNHAPPQAQVRSRPPVSRASSMYATSHGHGTVLEELESEPEPVALDEETEQLSRSSIDSIADEVQRTLRNQQVKTVAPTSFQLHGHTFPKRQSIISDNASVYSPRSDTGADLSNYSASITSSLPVSNSNDLPGFLRGRPTPPQAVAQYLRSARLTTLLKLTRSPHASQDNPLTVSLSDLGNPLGVPLVVFLGLGCVRHVMGLYDEMAECLGLRVITVDRWGLGRTEPRSKSAKGIMEWASVVEEVLDMLHIGQVSVMAHSAGAPYALSFANKLPRRIRGDICLLAPWVGGSEGGGYKWLKYVPNGILKTAQAAEWKVQAWMIGKPPTLAYEGIGYNAAPPSKLTPDRNFSPSQHPSGSLSVVYPSARKPRPSIGSSSFSEYDDLGDFDGRFESRSTLGVGGRTPYSRAGSEANITVGRRKTSRGFLDLLKGGSSQSSADDRVSSGKKLKGLRSMGSLKTKSSKKIGSTSPTVPSPPQLEVSLDLDDMRWDSMSHQGDTFGSDAMSLNGRGVLYTRYTGRRSISFSSPRSSPASHAGSPSPSVYNSPLSNDGPSSAYQATLGNALLAASHAESAKGTHNDLLQILNHDNHPWGFSYSSYPHKVRIWYGDKDEKIAENAVRWMESVMGPEHCSVKVVKGADHGLMYKSAVVVEVLERVRSFWPKDR